RQVLVEHGLPAAEPLLGAWSEGWGHEAVAKLFDGKGRAETPDAVFCGNDQIARGVIDALRERGIRVAEATRPPLTSVDMNLATLGREAGLALLSLVGGQAAAPGIRKLPCRLVVRQSCGRTVGG
ncbi:MAG: LacI family transcriptional regulator, partial [Mesorhizobium sp.]|uniref:substrate-binding domain-containing protein n=1 Tax=Mesorhizobium sp. TaxID=1871066 RepID=UPI0012114AA1